MLQVIRGIFEESEKTRTVATDENRPKIILIAANRREEDILFRDELASLQSRFPSHIQVHATTTPRHPILLLLLLLLLLFLLLLGVLTFRCVLCLARSTTC